MRKRRLTDGQMCWCVKPETESTRPKTQTMTQIDIINAYCGYVFLFYGM